MVNGKSLQINTKETSFQSQTQTISAILNPKVHNPEITESIRSY